MLVRVILASLSLSFFFSSLSYFFCNVKDLKLLCLVLFVSLFLLSFSGFLFSLFSSLSCSSFLFLLSSALFAFFLSLHVSVSPSFYFLASFFP